MTERASVAQGLQFGVETTPGTAVPASKLLNSVALDPGIKVAMQDFRPTGQKYSSIVVPGKEWMEAKLSGVASYSELQYILTSIGTFAAPVQQGATTAWKWTLIPAGRAADTIKTFTVQHGDPNTRAEQWTFGVFSELDINFSRDGVTLGGMMLGQKITDGATMTASPTAIEIQPILPTDVSVYLDPTSGALGTTKLSRVVHANVKISSRFNPVWTLDSANGSYVAVVETVPSVECELLVEADANGMALLTQLRGGSPQYLRINATSANLAGTAFPYVFLFDMAAKVSAVSDYSDEQGLYAITFTEKAFYDSAWGTGQAWQATLTNKQTAL
jgi:hypothetical protein